MSSSWSKIYFLVCLLLLQVQANKIIKFHSLEARNNYKKLFPGSKFADINSLFYGCIHYKSKKKGRSNRTLNLKRSALGISNIISDQVFKISNHEPPNSQSRPYWHLDRIDQRKLPLDNKYNHNPNETEVHVYVLDTGIKIIHSDFGGRARVGYSSYDENPTGTDCNGHGSHVAGLVGGIKAGVNKDALMYDVTALNCDGYGNLSNILLGLDWVHKNHKKPAIINMSFGSLHTDFFDSALRTIKDAGIFLVAAAGNEGEDTCLYSPAGSIDVFAVGATDKRDQLATFSNIGSCNNIYAPGVDVISVHPQNLYTFGTASGTSQAGPIVAGVASKLLQQNPAMTPNELKQKLLDTASQDVNDKIKPFVFIQYIPGPTLIPIARASQNVQTLMFRMLVLALMIFVLY
jgi:subtilisin family serine protease